MPETKLSHLCDNNQRAANIPAIDTFEQYYKFPYRRIRSVGYVWVHAWGVRMSKYGLTYRRAYILDGNFYDIP